MLLHGGSTNERVQKKFVKSLYSFYHSCGIFSYYSSFKEIAAVKFGVYFIESITELEYRAKKLSRSCFSEYDQYFIQNMIKVVIKLSELGKLCCRRYLQFSIKRPVRFEAKFYPSFLALKLCTPNALPIKFQTLEQSLRS